MPRLLPSFVLLRGALLVALFALFLLLGADGSPAAGTQRASADPELRLDARLARVADAYANGGDAAALAQAAEVGVTARGGRLRVIVEADGGDVETRARRLGAHHERSHGGLVQLLAPAAALRPLASLAGVQRVRPPLEAVPLVTGEGVSLTGANTWQSGGLTGSGVKVAVLDFGFTGFQSLLGNELPAGVVTRSFRADGDIGGGGINHGTKVAEIVAEMAPAATLYLVNFDTEVEFAAAVEWLGAQGVRAINASWGYFISGPGDGTGFIDQVVAESINDGVFWSVASGNHARQHWAGQFRDNDGDSLHEFASLDEANQVVGWNLGPLVPGEVITAALKWDDPFGAACVDYDFFLIDTDAGVPDRVVAFSTGIQHDGVSCVPGAYPIEVLTHTMVETDTYSLYVRKFIANRNARLNLYVLTHELEHRVAAGSVLQPGDLAAAMTVGAVDWVSPGIIEPYSSQGPNLAGVIKPDIVAPDGVSNTSGGGIPFFGTSAAAPHVTGAAALLLQRLPCYTPAQVKSFLEGRTVALGAAGKDNVFGSGRMMLGTLPADGDGDGIGDACDTPSTPTPAATATRTPTQTASATPSATLTPVPAGDSDGDGCDDALELGTNPDFGGDRDPQNPWDFFDVTGDQAVDLIDTLQILVHFGHLPGQDASDVILDRYAPNPLKPWQTAPAILPNIGVDLQDALLNMRSFGHSCAPS